MSTENLEVIARRLSRKGKAFWRPTRAFRPSKNASKRSMSPRPKQIAASIREMLFTTPGLGEFISGVILFDETIRQKADDGRPLPVDLAELGIIPGIKVDKSAKALASFPGERITEGLDGLRERFTEYRGLAPALPSGEP